MFWISHKLLLQLTFSCTVAFRTASVLGLWRVSVLTGDIWSRNWRRRRKLYQPQCVSGVYHWGKVSELAPTLSTTERYILYAPDCFNYFCYLTAVLFWVSWRMFTLLSSLPAKVILRRSWHSTQPNVEALNLTIATARVRESLYNRDLCIPVRHKFHIFLQLFWHFI